MNNSRNFRARIALFRNNTRHVRLSSQSFHGQFSYTTILLHKELICNDSNTHAQKACTESNNKSNQTQIFTSWLLLLCLDGWIMKRIAQLARLNRTALKRFSPNEAYTWKGWQIINKLFHALWLANEEKHGWKLLEISSSIVTVEIPFLVFAQGCMIRSTDVNDTC